MQAQGGYEKCAEIQSRKRVQCISCIGCVLEGVEGSGKGSLKCGQARWKQQMLMRETNKCLHVTLARSRDLGKLSTETGAV